jgi:pyruvate dehydrogenase E2 component (dihydrolipoamide acetyltransferase)
MAIDFKLPDLGENIESGDVVDVLVKEGDTIRADQEVIELETEKAVMPVPCPHAGVVRKIHVKKGDTIPVGGTVLTVEAVPAAAGAGDKRPEPPAARAAPAPQPAKPSPAPESQPREKTATQTAAVATRGGGPRRPGRPGADGPHKREGEGPDGQKPAAEQPDEKPDGRTPSDEPVSLEDRPAERARAEDGGRAPAEAVSAVPPASPETRRYARELGVDIHQVRGTGEGGRITKDDVKAAVRAAFQSPGAIPPAPSAGAPQARRATDRPPPPEPARAAESQSAGEAGRDPWGPIRRAPLSRIRETIAANMARSASTIPHVTNFDDADITELERIRKGSMADYVGDVKLTMMSFVLKAVAMALKHHAEVNASLDLEHKQIIYKDYVNVGVAVDTPRGLVVPVMRDVDRLSIPQIAQSMARLADDARNARFKVDDLRGGTFTVSNLGAVGGTYSTPIINHPEVAVLLVGRSRKLPVVTDDDDIQVRLMMPLSLSYDHRLVDGATAARFLNDVIEFLEVPGRLLLAP